MTFAQRLKSRMEMMQVSGKYLAETCGISVGHVSQMQAGRRLPSGAVLEAMCRVLGMDVVEEWCRMSREAGDVPDAVLSGLGVDGDLELLATRLRDAAISKIAESDSDRHFGSVSVWSGGDDSLALRLTPAMLLAAPDEIEYYDGSRRRVEFTGVLWSVVDGFVEDIVFHWQDI